MLLSKVTIFYQINLFINIDIPSYYDPGPLLLKKKSFLVLRRCTYAFPVVLIFRVVSSRSQLISALIMKDVLLLTPFTSLFLPIKHQSLSSANFLFKYSYTDTIVFLSLFGILHFLLLITILDETNTTDAVNTRK